MLTVAQSRQVTAKPVDNMQCRVKLKEGAKPST